MVAGPSQAIINQALQTRDSGVTITGSDRFTSMLPQDGEVNFSGVVYQNLGALLGPLVKLGAAASKLTQDQMTIAQELSSEARPSLIVAYGGKDSITLVFTHEGGLLSSGVASFFSLKGLMGVKDMVGQSVMQMGN